MELRSIPLLLTLAAATGAPASVREYPLDEATVYSIRIGVDEPTTCLFPGTISALEAAHLSARTEDAPPVLLAHQAGTNYFSVRALREDARAAANVVLGGRVYALRFLAGDAPDRTVRFRDRDLPAPAETWRRLLHQARTLDHAAALRPQAQREVRRVQPGTVTEYRDFRVVTETVLRFDAEDALVLRIRLENPGRTPVTYEPAGLAVWVDRSLYPSSWTEASGVIPAEGSAVAWLLIAGAPEGGRNDLPADLPFNIIVPRAP